MSYRIKAKQTLARAILVLVLGALFLIPHRAPLADGGGSVGPIPHEDTTATDTIHPVF